ncbi:thiamine pyrophosphate-dependent enzyme [Methanovulcanius yangii]|uniref:thiamine pyrophosphate-dependent enzyme n=1 Tax=Methanovulcanius yangii TaxID=1789227 RepID=UPI0029CA69FF|nr:thiamine pyrophosphate-dependent enzyme [Methanovulcanius yangii]
MNGEATLSRALNAAADRWYAVPGYPVTGIADACRAEITVNEKVALEYALGDSLSGRRAAVIMKNVGLNACADTLVAAAVEGTRAGVVILAGDDEEVSGSQHAQDSRCYGKVAGVPVFSPRPDEFGEAVETAFRASEMFSRPAILRIASGMLTRPAGGVPLERKGIKKPRPDDRGLTMRGRSEAAEYRRMEMCIWASSSAPRYITYPPKVGSESGCTTIDISGDPPQTVHTRGYARTFCHDCPFLPVLGLMREREILPVCDIGCAVLAKNPPYSLCAASYSLGSSPAVAATSTGTALTGDYALLHSGINALIDIAEKERDLLLVVLANGTMGMTGGQRTPDILPYLSWADPIVCAADDIARIEEQLLSEKASRKGLRIICIVGECPPGAHHETVEC